MKAMVVLTAGWSAFAFLLIWLTERIPIVIFYWVDPAEAARWEACKAMIDPWLGGPI